MIELFGVLLYLSDSSSAISAKSLLLGNVFFLEAGVKISLDSFNYLSTLPSDFARFIIANFCTIRLDDKWFSSVVARVQSWTHVTFNEACHFFTKRSWPILGLKRVVLRGIERRAFTSLPYGRRHHMCLNQCTNCVHLFFFIEFALWSKSFNSSLCHGLVNSTLATIRTTVSSWVAFIFCSSRRYFFSSICLVVNGFCTSKRSNHFDEPPLLLSSLLVALVLCSRSRLLKIRVHVFTGSSLAFFAGMAFASQFCSGLKFHISHYTNGTITGSLFFS